MEADAGLRQRIGLLVQVGVLLFFISGCADTYYGAMEKAGYHKRDIMVDRVEKARDSQAEAQEQFQSALAQFDSVIKLEETDLKKAYDKLNAEFEDSLEVADKVSNRIDKVEAVAGALFEEWEDELELYQSAELRRDSKVKLDKTRVRYKKMVSSMHQAEMSMDPVLRLFQDNVLYLKHNLNAQAIGSLQGEFATLKSEISQLVNKMNLAIDNSNTFIAGIK